MHYICFSPGLRPEPCCGAHDTPSDSLVGWEEGRLLDRVNTLLLITFHPQSSLIGLQSACLSLTEILKDIVKQCKSVKTQHKLLQSTYGADA